MANKFHMCNIVPTYSGSSHFTNCTYNKIQNRRHTYHTTPFRSSNIANEQQGFHHRGLPRSNKWCYSISVQECYGYVFHNSNKLLVTKNITTCKEHNLWVQFTVIHYDSTDHNTRSTITLRNLQWHKSKVEAWTEWIEMQHEYWVKTQCI